jgi:hypothetical protein
MPLSDVIEPLNWLQNRVKDKYPDFHYLFEDFYKSVVRYSQIPNENDLALIRMSEIAFLSRFADTPDDPFINGSIAVVIELTTATNSPILGESEAHIKNALDELINLRNLDRESNG